MARFVVRYFTVWLLTLIVNSICYEDKFYGLIDSDDEIIVWRNFFDELKLLTDNAANEKHFLNGKPFIELSNAIHLEYVQQITKLTDVDAKPLTLLPNSEELNSYSGSDLTEEQRLGYLEVQQKLNELVQRNLSELMVDTDTLRGNKQLFIEYLFDTFYIIDDKYVCNKPDILLYNEFVLNFKKGDDCFSSHIKLIALTRSKTEATKKEILEFYKKMVTQNTLSGEIFTKEADYLLTNISKTASELHAMADRLFGQTEKVGYYSPSDTTYTETISKVDECISFVKDFEKPPKDC